MFIVWTVHASLQSTLAIYLYRTRNAQFHSDYCTSKRNKPCGKRNTSRGIGPNHGFISCINATLLKRSSYRARENIKVYGFDYSGLNTREN
jgi:hypothetical protein